VIRATVKVSVVVSALGSAAANRGRFGAADLGTADIGTEYIGTENIGTENMGGAMTSAGSDAPADRAPLGLDPRLWEVLACPCPAHGDLRANEANSTLTCTVCAAVFRVEDGIPIMLLDED